MKTTAVVVMYRISPNRKSKRNQKSIALKN